MERHSLKTGTLNWIALLGLAIGLEVVSMMADSATAELGAAFTLVGLVTSLVAWFQMRLEASEETERLEMEELARSRSKAAPPMSGTRPHLASMIESWASGLAKRMSAPRAN